MKPVLELPLLIPLLAILLVVGIYVSWRSTQDAKSPLRLLLIALRALALIAIAVFLLNPGDWISKTSERDQLYPIMIDNSISMATISDEKSGTRSAVAHAFAQTILSAAETSDIETKLYAFSADSKQIGDLSELNSKGKDSNIYRSGTSIFTQLQSAGKSPEALIILTDGRQTALSKGTTLALQSRANNAPIYAVSIGSDVLKKDLSVVSARRTITAFPQQNLQVTAVVENQNLGNQSIALSLTDSEGKEIATQQLEVEENKKVIHTFSVKSPEASTRYNLKINQSADEHSVENNTSLVNVRILTTKTRVFIAEGAPYWDSKFLAQLLRQQGHMDVHSVHRLSDDRWFRIDSGQSDPTASSDDVFPDSLEDLSHYDLIIFGKNSEHFLNAKRIELLKGFVRDQGGAILFSRGKPYSGRMRDLEALEPVNWASNSSSKFIFSPTADGQSAGLFGQALPAPESPIWKSLPSLKDAHDVDSVKPFTRVLAEGSLPGSKGKFPLLMVRRYGQGVSGLVNADGLWKWDFYPEARELGNMYQEFWTQLIQWMVAYSEFLPGHDYSLHASSQIVSLQDPVVFSVSYRGSRKSPHPSIVITADGQDPVTISAAASTPVGGKPAWKCSFVPDRPGTYLATLITGDDSPAPTLNIEVTAPPAEMDNLNPDPDFLRELCESTGGRLLTSEELPVFLKEQFGSQSKSTMKAEVVWQSSWMQWFVPIIVLVILAAEWWIRRRNGLI